MNVLDLTEVFSKLPYNVKVTKPCHKKVNAVRLNLNDKVKMGGSILKLRIEIVGLHRRAWRSILIPQGATWYDLHLAIQGAFQWTHCHRFQFRKGKDRKRFMYEDEFTFNYADSTCVLEKMTGGYNGGTLDADKYGLDYYLKAVGDDITYLYDFGDRWDHSIVVEEVLPTPTLPLPQGDIYPKCVAGERKGPPENAGGPSGFKKVCKLLAKPEDSMSEEEWPKRHEITCCYGYRDPDKWTIEDCKFELECVNGKFRNKWITEWTQKLNDPACQVCYTQADPDRNIQIRKCARCNNASYCGRDCQKYDWKYHKQVCRR